MNTIGTIVGLQGAVNCLEQICANQEVYRRFNVLPHLLMALDAGDGQSTFTRFFARNAAQHQLRHFGGMDTYLEFTLTGEMTQLQSVFQQIRDCAVYTNEYEGIIALDISALANCINEAQIPYFLEQVKRCAAHATMIFYIPRTPSRNLNLLVSKLRSCVDELVASSMILDEVKSKLDAEGVPYDRSIRVGAMIEVPSAALIADELARHVDFFSIGTNDLVQYTMAADRGNEAVAHLYQPTNPAVLKLVRMTVDAARAAGISVGVCGESAADPIVGVLWAAMGVDHLSMSSTYIPLISKILAHLTREDLEEYARVPLSMPPGETAHEICDACHAWLAEKIPNLDDILI